MSVALKIAVVPDFLFPGKTQRVNIQYLGSDHVHSSRITCKQRSEVPS
jgi:hypothetical protein